MRIIQLIVAHLQTFCALNIRLFVAGICSLMLIACSESSSKNNFITPNIAPPLDAYVLTGTRLISINPDADPVILTNVVENLGSALTLDTDSKDSRELDQDYINDRGILPEYMAYIKQNEPSRLYILVFESQKELLLYDLATYDGESHLICQIVNSSYPDLAPLSRGKLELKQELKVYLITSDGACDDPSSYAYFSLSIMESADGTYFVRQPVKAAEDNSDAGASDPNKLEIVTYPLLIGERASVNASETASSLVIYSQNNGFGNLGFDTETGTLAFYTQITPSEEDMIELWSTSFNYALDSDNKPSRPKVFFGPDPDSAFVFLLNGRELFKFSKSDLFALGNEIKRQASLATPVYTWSIDSDPANRQLIQLGASEYALIDGQKVLTMDSTSQVTLVKDYTNSPAGEEKTLHLHSPANNLILRKQFADKASLNSLTSSGIESTIQAHSSLIFTYDNLPNFDYVSNGQRFAQSDSGSGPAHAPDLENSVWMPLYNYIEDREELYILSATSSPEGVLSSPIIYSYDSLELEGQGELFGNFSDDVARVVDAKIISQTFGLIEVKSSFTSDEIETYYFNPSAKKPYDLYKVE